MPQFANKDLAELAHQLPLSPKRQRLAQIMGIESLLRIITLEKSYPYDMVCYQITGYRNRRTPTRPTIEGRTLTSDLALLADRLTRKNAIPVEEIREPFRTFEELAVELKVSTKTVRRWGRRGLLGFRAVFPDGVSRLIFLHATVERFVEQNKEIVERGASFKQLTAQEKTRIVDLARTLLGERRRKLHVVAREIAAQTGRAVETVRYTLRRHDQAHPDAALFAGNGLPSAPPLHRQVWRAYGRGDSVVTLAGDFALGRKEIRRIIREMTARQLKADPVSYVFNELFDAPNAEAIILDAPRPPGREKNAKVRVPRDLPAYLKSLYATPLMTAEQEADIFRRYNFCKHKLSRWIEALDVCVVKQGELDAIAELQCQIESVRREIVQANLRLVVSIAKKHVGWSPRFFEVISDGNMSLLRAVEKFDYARGFKFSTYASWAIVKNYARTVPEEHYRFSRYVTGQAELIEATAGTAEDVGADHDSKALTQALKASMSDLTERERTIVTGHFGLFDSGPAQTLEALGARFGVTKERARQIERRAIGKMKQVLSPELAELRLV